MPWLGRFCLRWPGLVVFAVVVAVSALLATFLGPQPLAQEQNDYTWPGTVEVSEVSNAETGSSTISVDLKPGETKTYYLRLTAQTVQLDRDGNLVCDPGDGTACADAGGWWVRIRVDGLTRDWGEYKGYSWIPSLGWEFDETNWDRWRSVDITAADDVEGPVTFSHEVWANSTFCPVHGEGSVDVEVDDSGESDDDLPSLSIRDASVTEGGTARFRVTLSTTSESTVTVRYRTQDDTATAGSDYSSRSSTLTFSAGTTEQFIDVATTQDTLDEPNETFTVTLSSPSGATLDDGTATGTINDNDAPPSLSIAHAEANEGDVATFDVMLSPASGKSVTVNYATGNGTALAGQDFDSTSGSLTFDPNTTQRTVRVQTREDAIDEPDETFTVRLNSPGEATLGTSTATGTIRDDDNPPALSIGDTTVEEGNSAQFTVTLSPASGKTVTVNYATADGSAQQPADYSFRSGPLTFSPGDLRKTVSVPTIGDNIADDGETFTVNLSGASNATVQRNQGTATITDDDLPTLSIRDATVEEGNSAQFTVTLSMTSTQTVTVRYGTSDGTAEAGNDYTAVQDQTLTFAPNDNRKTISVQTLEDMLEENNETFTVTLSSPNGATVQRGAATGTITDDDTGNGGSNNGGSNNGGSNNGGSNNGGSNNGGSNNDGENDGGNSGGNNRDNNNGVEENELGFGSAPSLPGLSIADTTVEEGNFARFMVTLSPASDRTVTVRYRTKDGTAREGSDYRGVSRTLVFLPGDTVHSVLVWANEDGLDEPDETFRVELYDPNGAVLADGSGTGTITEHEEEAPERTEAMPRLSIVDAAAVEGEPAPFAVRLSPASERTVTVRYRTAGGTATAGRDFEGTFGTLSFAPGSTRQVVQVPTREDDLDEPDETFTVTLSNPVGATLADGTATGTIVDDDPVSPPAAPRPELAIADATVVEGETARFPVALSRASEEAVTVFYRTAGGTAAAGQDFDSQAGILTFAPGSRRQVIAVPTRDDERDEPNETFSVTLSSAAGATLGDRSATGTIVDDDVPAPPPAVSIEDATAVEGEAARFAVGLSRASERAVTVSYLTAGGTALEGRDFDALAGTLTFAPGTVRQTVAVQTREDDLDEPDETFEVMLRGPNGATIEDGTATGTITDDDVRPLEPVNRQLLPEIGRALAFTAVRCRIEQAFSDMARGWAEPAVDSPLTLPPIPDGFTGVDRRSPELEDVLASTSFLLPLADRSDGGIRFATWGCGDYQSLSGDGGQDSGDWDGEALSVQVGAEAIVGRNLLAGLSLSQSRAALDFDGPGGAGPTGGSYDLGLTGVHPYLGWWISPGLELWGSFGVAHGDLEIADAAAGSSATSAATLASATLGIDGRLLTLGAATVRLKGEGALAQLDVSKNAGSFQGASAEMQRLRLAAEVEYEYLIADAGVLVPWAELGLRHEGGDGGSGSGLELGGGLHYRDIEQGWNAEVYGRLLALRDDALPEEQGFGVRFRYDPEPPGLGPWVSLAQTWGEPASGLHRLWHEGVGNLTGHDPQGRRLVLEVGYGFPALGGSGALTPYGAVSLEDSDARAYRLGTRVSLGSSARLSLEGERRARPAAPADHRIKLRAIARF